jgi:hypothetical protein
VGTTVPPLFEGGAAVPDVVESLDVAPVVVVVVVSGTVVVVSGTVVVVSGTVVVVSGTVVVVSGTVVVVSGTVVVVVGSVVVVVVVVVVVPFVQPETTRFELSVPCVAVADWSTSFWGVSTTKWTEPLPCGVPSTVTVPACEKVAVST